MLTCVHHPNKLFSEDFDVILEPYLKVSACSSDSRVSTTRRSDIVGKSEVVQHPVSDTSLRKMNDNRLEIEVNPRQS